MIVLWANLLSVYVAVKMLLALVVPHVSRASTPILSRVGSGLGYNRSDAHRYDVVTRDDNVTMPRLADFEMHLFVSLSLR